MEVIDKNLVFISFRTVIIVWVGTFFFFFGDPSVLPHCCSQLE